MKLDLILIISHKNIPQNVSLRSNTLNEMLLVKLRKYIAEDVQDSSCFARMKLNEDKAVSYIKDRLLVF